MDNQPDSLEELDQRSWTFYRALGAVLLLIGLVKLILFGVGTMSDRINRPDSMEWILVEAILFLLIGACALFRLPVLDLIALAGLAIAAAVVRLIVQADPYLLHTIFAVGIVFWCFKVRGIEKRIGAMQHSSPRQAPGDDKEAGRSWGDVWAEEDPPEE